MAQCLRGHDRDRHGARKMPSERELKHATAPAFSITPNHCPGVLSGKRVENCRECPRSGGTSQTGGFAESTGGGSVGLPLSRSRARGKVREDNWDLKKVLDLDQVKEACVGGDAPVICGLRSLCDGGGRRGLGWKMTVRSAASSSRRDSDELLPSHFGRLQFGTSGQGPGESRVGGTWSRAAVGYMREPFVRNLRQSA